MLIKIMNDDVKDNELNMKIVCSVYRSARVEGMYVYVNERDGLARLSDDLLARFGKPELAMTLDLYPERKLARADVNKVLAAIAENGFYLQMPPKLDAAALPEINAKMPATHKSVTSN
jgi:uncharacterized protein